MLFWSNEDGSDNEFDLRRLFQIFAASAAMALALFVAVWVVDYFNVTAGLDLLTNLSTFIKSNWYIVVGFIFFISIWEYIYPMYSKKLKYVKPIVDATSLMFGLWLVAIFLKGLAVFVEASSPPALFLGLLHDLYFTQFAVIYLLFIFVGYSKVFWRR